MVWQTQTPAHTRGGIMFLGERKNTLLTGHIGYLDQVSGINRSENQLCCRNVIVQYKIGIINNCHTILTVYSYQYSMPELYAIQIVKITQSQ